MNDIERGGTPQDAKEWKAPTESAEQEYVPFGEADEAEQIKRTRHLRNTFSSDSSFAEFWDNAYKYTEQLPITGSSPEDAEKAIQQAAQGTRFMSEVLEMFKQIKVRESGKQVNLDFSTNELQSSLNAAGLLDKGRIKTEKLQKMMTWALDSHRRKGAELGRPSELSPEDIQHAGEDIEYILKKVNDYLPPREK